MIGLSQFGGLAEAAGAATSQAEAARKVAGPLVVVTVAGIVVVLVALALWAIHWGQRLRQFDHHSAAPGKDKQADPDPWQVAGQRLKPPPKDPDEQEPS